MEWPAAWVLAAVWEEAALGRAAWAAAVWAVAFQSLRRRSGHLAALDDGGSQFSIKSFRHHQAVQIALQPRDGTAAYLQDLCCRGRPRALLLLGNASAFCALPDFYLDCADFFFDRHESLSAIQVLSNLAELESGDLTLLRLMGHRLARAGDYDLAIETFEEILKKQPNEPQSYRDLALLLVQRAENARAVKSSHRQPPGRDEPLAKDRSKAEIAADYARAMELLTQIVVRRWDLAIRGG